VCEGTSTAKLAKMPREKFNAATKVSLPCGLELSVGILFQDHAEPAKAPQGSRRSSGLRSVLHESSQVESHCVVCFGQLSGSPSSPRGPQAPPPAREQKPSSSDDRFQVAQRRFVTQYNCPNNVR
jgi:hypothetical protein